MKEELSKGFTGIEINGVRFSNIKEMLIYMNEQRDRIIDLEKENDFLKGRNKGFEIQIMGLLIKYEEVYKRFPDLKSAMDKAQTILKENAELKKVAEFQQSSNMSRHFEIKNLKEGLAVGSMWNKHLNSLNKELEEDRDRYRNMVFDKDEHLTKAKELLKEFVQHYKAKTIYIENMQDLLEQAEQFLNSEVEK